VPRIYSTERTITATSDSYPLDEAQVVAPAFLARYRGPTMPRARRGSPGAHTITCRSAIWSGRGR
jgi:hypothetical protein